MSVQLIQQYHAQVEKIIRYGGSRKETAVRKPSKTTLTVSVQTMQIINQMPEE